MTSFLEQLGIENEFSEVIANLGIKRGGERFGVTRFRASIPTQTPTEADKKALETSLYLWQRNQANQTNVNVDAGQEPSTPTGDQIVKAEFRALSQTLLRNRGLDFSQPGVLETGVAMLMGKAVYPNHDFADINNSLGSVSKTWWDSAGADSNGIPGINCEIQIDALMNLKIARGLMMTPPFINSMSLTVAFEFDYSHPNLVEDRKFWGLIGQEVDGQIVRLIVTKIVDIWEASLVSLPEDRNAKKLPGESGEKEESFSADVDKEPAAEIEDKEETMKLTKEELAALGFDEAVEDVTSEQLRDKAVELAAANSEFNEINITELQANAKAGKDFTEEKRAEVSRLAKLAELGADEGELSEVIADDIKDANYDRLAKLHTHYETKAAEKFPNISRSSLEDSSEVEKAGGVDADNQVESFDVDDLHG